MRLGPVHNAPNPGLLRLRAVFRTRQCTNRCLNERAGLSADAYAIIPTPKARDRMRMINQTRNIVTMVWLR